MPYTDSNAGNVSTVTDAQEASSKIGTWKHEFRLAEYKLIKKEILQEAQERSRTQFAAVVAVGSVYSWFLVHPPEGVARFAWWIGPIVTFLAGLRSSELTLRIQAFGAYLREVEEIELGNALKAEGWDRYKFSKRRWFDRIADNIAIVAWLFLVIASSYASYRLSAHP
jgi:hypothetical protein